MVSNEDRAAEFFAAYRRTFESLEPDSIAGHFAFPLQIIGEGDEVDIRTLDQAEFLETLKMLVDVYRGFGVVTAYVIDSSTTVLSDRVMQCAIHWSLRNSDDDEVYDFHAIYTLVEKDGSLKIAAISHDELPRITALLSGTTG